MNLDSMGLMSEPVNADLRSSDLVIRTATTLRDRIIDGQLRPGAQLAEEQLAGDLAVSRNTLREAFRVLISENLLKRVAHRGVFVREPDLADVLDLYRVRQIIEVQAIVQADPRHPAIVRLGEIVASAQKHREAGRWREVGSDNMAFHAAIVSLMDSPRLDEMFAQIQAETRLAFALIADWERMHAPFVDDNIAIAQLLSEGRVAKAAAQLTAYLARSERTAAAALQKR